jgi:hypothetical protein
LRRGAGEVDHEARVRDRQRDGDAPVDRLEAVVVDRLLGAPRSLREAGEAGAEAAVGMGQHRLEEIAGAVGADSSTSSASRSAPMRVEPIIACRSPSSASGRRVLSISSRHRSARVFRPSISFSTGSRIPSWKISVAAEL